MLANSPTVPFLPLRVPIPAWLAKGIRSSAAPAVGRHLSPASFGTANAKPHAAMRWEERMFGLDYMLAAMLLQGAEFPSLQDPKSTPAWHALVGKPMTQLALSCELLDPREVRYVLTKSDEFISDVRMLQRRAHDLNQAPYLHDSARFPEKAIVNDLLLFNRAYRQHLESCLPLYPNNADLRAAKEEVEQLYQIWDCVRDARCEYYYVHIRRQALKRLHDMLGDADYQQANLPPHVPYWRFTQVR